MSEAEIRIHPKTDVTQFIRDYGCRVELREGGKLYTRTPPEQTMRAVLRNMEAFVGREA